MNMNTLVRKLIFPTCMKLGEQYSPRSLDKRCGSQVHQLHSGPSVSVVVPSYNQAKYIEATLNSLLSQQYSPLEIIVIDGGSTDGTVDILKRFEPHLAYWESQPDRGQTHAINKGFSHATGEIMAWLNSDDLLLPGAISRVVKRFQTQPSVNVVYGQRIIINEFGEDIGTWNIKNAHGEVLQYADFIPQETLFWRRDIWNSIGKLDEKFKFAMDWDLLLRFKLANARFSVIEQYQGAFRFHSEQKTVCEIGSTGFAEMELLRNGWAQQLGKREYDKKRMLRSLLTFALITRGWELARRLKGGG